MKIGAMNHPGRPVLDEIESFAALGLDFVDLTLEPPLAAPDQVDLPAIRRRLEDHGLAAVGHTAYYLPIGSSFASLRHAAIEELKRALEAFAAVGVRWMNVHPDGHAPFVADADIMQRNIDSLHALAETARATGVGIMVENVPGRFNSANQLDPLLSALPDVGLHLDIGHCNLGVERNTTDELLDRFAARLAHVHLHDNRGGHADLHLALGQGHMDIPHYVRCLKRSRYDGTITLEVFSADTHFLAYSRDRLREWWDAA